MKTLQMDVTFRIIVVLALLLMVSPFTLLSQVKPTSVDARANLLRKYQAFKNGSRLPARFLPQYQSSDSRRQSSANMDLSGKQMLDEVIYESLDATSGQFVITHKVAYNYTAAGQMYRKLKYNWNDSLNQWQIAYIEELTIDTTGKTIQRVSSEYDQSAQLLNPTVKIEYAYDTLGLLNLSFQYNFDKVAQLWVNVMNTVYHYNEQSELISELSYFRYNPETRWEVAAKDEYFYNSNGLVISSRTSFWMPDTRTWLDFWKVEYAYDSFGNMISEIIIPWDTHTGKFIPDYKYESVYDYTTDASMLILPPPAWLISDASKQILHKPLGANMYNYQEPSWVPDRRATCHYTEVSSTELAPAGFGSVKVFPNPANGIINMELKEMTDSGTIELFDSSGRKIASAEFTGRTSLNIADKASGIVSYLVVSKNYRQSGKILLNR